MGISSHMAFSCHLDGVYTFMIPVPEKGHVAASMERSSLKFWQWGRERESPCVLVKAISRTIVLENAVC